jgi:thiamine biosynthesis protein ThiI
MSPDEEIPAPDSILVRYGELGLKDNNRGLFEKQLRDNIQHRLNSLDTDGVKRFQGGMKVNLNDTSPVETILDRLEDVPGVAWFASCWEATRDPRSVAETILSAGQDRINIADSFAISTQRSDKSLELNSQEYNVKVGGYIDEQTDLYVDLDDPDWDVGIHLLYDRAYCFFEKRKGLGGLPAEASGEILTLLSGGIDSPVASVKMFKRGCRQDFLHYYPYPNAETALETKMRKLVSRLADFGTHGKLYMVPYHVYDLHSSEVDERDKIISFRRHMIRLAERILDHSELGAIATGSSLGQVASQTLHNIHTIGSVTDYPVLRPLIGFDKDEIIKHAKEYGTYDLSIQNYQDCCSIQSKRVRTRSNPDRFRTLEQNQNTEELDQAVLEATDVFEYGAGSLNLLEDENPLNVESPETNSAKNPR